MALTKRPMILSEVLIRKDQSTYATVTVAEDATLQIGTLLITQDGGVTWETRAEPAWVDGSYDTGDKVFHNGHLWNSLIDANDVVPGSDPAKWNDLGVWGANGVLLEYAEATGKYEVMKSGYVVEKHVVGFHENMRVSLFDKSILLK